jgi:hypothetical protein
MTVKAEERMLQVAGGVTIVLVTVAMVWRFTGQGHPWLLGVALYLTGVVGPLMSTRQLLRHASVADGGRRDLLYAPLMAGVPTVAIALALLGR